MVRLRVVLFALVLSSFVLIKPSSAHAALLVVDKDGNIVWNVLASEDQNILPIPKDQTIEVKNVLANGSTPQDAQITLNRDGGRVSLDITSNQGTSQTDVTGYNKDLIEIEAKEDAKRIKIANDGDKFSISQKDITASTVLPIQINSKLNQLLVTTPAGSQLIAVLPYDALAGVLRANVINDFSTAGKMEIIAGGSGELQYSIEGLKKLNILNLFELPVKITTFVSPTTGEIIKTDEPVYARLLGFLFS